MAYCDYLEGRGYPVSLFIEDEHAILYPSRCEEAYVPAAGQFLRCASDVVRGWRHAVYWTNDVEMVGYESFVGDEEEKREIFEDSNLCYTGISDDLDMG
jgi:hypothetical protein